jgi:oligosaccharide repeat unit polymerase
MKRFALLNRFLISPLFLIISISLLSLALNLMFFDSWSDAHRIYFLGICAFVIGFIWIRFPFATICTISKKNFNSSRHANSFVLKLYWFFALLGFTICLYIFFSRGVMGSGSLFHNLRYAHTVAHQSRLGASHLTLFGFALVLYYTYKKNLKYAVLALILSMGPTFAFAQRTGFLMLLIGFTYVGLWVRLFSLKQVVTVISFFILISTVIAAGTNKLFSAEGSFYLFRYAGYGFSSFQQWILNTEPVFCVKPVLGNVFGSVIDIIAGNTCTDMPGAPSGKFNVYTYLGAPYSFAGIKGVVCCMFVLGLMYGALFTAAKKKQGYFLMLLAAWTYPLIMVFYAWQFSLTTFIYLIFIFAPLFCRIPWSNNKVAS